MDSDQSSSPYKSCRKGNDDLNSGSTRNSIHRSHEPWTFVEPVNHVHPLLESTRTRDVSTFHRNRSVVFLYHQVRVLHRDLISSPSRAPLTFNGRLMRRRILTSIPVLNQREENGRGRVHGPGNISQRAGNRPI